MFMSYMSTISLSAVEEHLKLSVSYYGYEA